MLHIKIDEKLNVNKDKVPETLKEQIEEMLPNLEEAIIERLGDPKLRNFDFGLTLEENKTRFGNQQFIISSNNLIELTGPIGKATYNEFIFITWGGTIDTGENTIWFNPKFQFKYKDGGSNSNNALWTGIWYNIDEHEWVFGRVIS